MKFKLRERPEPQDLLLTPMLDLFIALIPFLLVSAAFVRLGGLKVNVPQAAAAADQKKDEKEKVSLAFEVNSREVLVTAFQESFSKPVKALETKIDVNDLQKLTDYLTSIKTKHTFGGALFHASQDTPYEKVVQVLEVIHSVPEISTETVLAVGMVN